MIQYQYLPILVNNLGHWTPHEYCGSKMITLGEVTEVQVTGIAHMYRCTVTGAERRWGFDAPSGHGLTDATRGVHA